MPMNLFLDYQQKVQTRKAALLESLQRLLPTHDGWKTLEIGCGHGDFLVHYAQQYPDRFCFGIDLLAHRLASAARKAQRAEVKNSCFLQASAEEFLECQPSSVFWNEVFILYPDPWPKRRHHKHRLLQSEFFTLLAARMVPRGCVYFETDDVAYREAVIKNVEQHPRWILVDREPYVVDTVFSRRMGQGQQLIFQCQNREDKSA